MAKKSLEEGLNDSANKRGFSGKERHRYIGGAIRNMEKRGEITAKKGAVRSTSPAPARNAPPRPAPKPRERLALVVKKNGPASAQRSYDVYSLYKEGEKTPYNSSTFRKRSAATQAAKVEMEAHNHPKGVHTQKRLVR
jgi:hypothetical protein